MDVAIIIPARMAATRFRGKPLAKIAGMSMIGHCFLRASMSKLAKQVYVATCDEEIAEEIYRLNGQVIMTSSKHERASDRTAEAICKLEEKGIKVDFVTMLQGDEPLVHPECLDALIQKHKENSQISVVNLTQYIYSDDDFHNINTVKIITNLQSDILAFSREAIPSPRLKGLMGYRPKKQLGVISFRRDALHDFYRLEPTPLEKIESIDMMRLLENGRSIKELLTDFLMQGVDTLEDAQKVEKIMANDSLFQTYKNRVDTKELVSG